MLNNCIFLCVSIFSVHPSEHDPGMMQMPLQNTGSLPDLTNVDFSSPINIPLDQDHSSPYGSVSILYSIF